MNLKWNKFIQFMIVILAIIFAIMKGFQGSDFKLMSDVSYISFILAVCILIMTIIRNIEQKNFLNDQKIIKRIYITLIIVVSLIIIPYISIRVNQAIDPQYADLFSIIALGISLANDFLAGLLSSVILRKHDIDLMD